MLRLPELHCLCRPSAVFFLLGSIVLPRCIDILMTEYICHQIDVTCFAVQIRTIGTAQLMRCDLLLKRLLSMHIS